MSWFKGVSPFYRERIMPKVQPLYVPPQQRRVGYWFMLLWRNFLGCWPLVGLLAVGFVGSFFPALISMDGIGMRATQFFLRLWCRGVLTGFGVRAWIKGADNIVPGRPYVIAVSHRSHLDIPALVLSLPMPVTAVYKKSLSWVPIFGQALALGRGVPISREDGRDARRSMAIVAHRMKTGRSLMIFPEGTRSRGKGLGSFKKGAVVTAINQQCDILPITITGTDALYPPGQLMIHRGDVLVTVHKPMPTAGLTTAQRDELNEKLKAVIESAFVSGPVALEQLDEAVRLA